MSNLLDWPTAMFGGLLWGGSAVRYVFIDEAGTSEVEPVTIVLALIVHADTQVMFAERALAEHLRAVPTEFQAGFISHATQVWGDLSYRDAWAMSDRVAFFEGDDVATSQTWHSDCIQRVSKEPG